MSEERREIEWGSRPLRYRLRRSGRVRSVQLRIDVTRGLEVLVPRRLPRDFDESPFLREHADWIDAQMRRLAERRAALPPVVYADGGRVPFFGSPCPLAVSLRAGRSRVGVRYRGGKIEILSPKPLAAAEIRSAVIALGRETAREVLISRVRHWGRELGVMARGITIREQETRWGSCSSEGRLSFNWRLVLGPPDLIDYVAAHEVAHLRHFDHGPEWEAALDSVLADWRIWERWLDESGDLLVLPEVEEGERAHQDSNLGPTD